MPLAAGVVLEVEPGHALVRCVYDVVDLFKGVRLLFFWSLL